MPPAPPSAPHDRLNYARGCRTRWRGALHRVGRAVPFGRAAACLLRAAAGGIGARRDFGSSTGWPGPARASPPRAIRAARAAQTHKPRVSPLRAPLTGRTRTPALRPRRRRDARRGAMPKPCGRARRPTFCARRDASKNAAARLLRFQRGTAPGRTRRRTAGNPRARTPAARRFRDARVAPRGPVSAPNAGPQTVRPVNT